MALKANAADEIVARYPQSRSAILPLLWLAQNTDGYITPAAVSAVAAHLGLTVSEVESVLSFYTMFRREPPARCRLQVCRSLACAMRGTEEILRAIEAATGVAPGGRSPDDQCSVEVVECIAACDHAPAYLFNERMDGPLTADRALELLRGEGGKAQ